MNNNFALSKNELQTLKDFWCLKYYERHGAEYPFLKLKEEEPYLKHTARQDGFRKTLVYVIHYFEIDSDSKYLVRRWQEARTLKNWYSSIPEIQAHPAVRNANLDWVHTSVEEMLHGKITRNGRPTI